MEKNWIGATPIVQAGTGIGRARQQRRQHCQAVPEPV